MSEVGGQVQVARNFNIYTDKHRKYMDAGLTSNVLLKLYPEPTGTFLLGFVRLLLALLFCLVLFVLVATVLGFGGSWKHQKFILVSRMKENGGAHRDVLTVRMRVRM